MNRRKPLIAGNWKMNKSVDEAIEFVNSFQQDCPSSFSCDVVIAPSFLALHAVGKRLKDQHNIQLSAQNVHPQPSGAFTGEVSPLMLKETGCTFCIVGHSERRQLFQESDSFIHDKICALLDIDIQPIFCIGETLQERENSMTFEKLSHQISIGLQSLSPAQAKKIIFAYEPVWAIGTGKTATPLQAQDVHAFLRQQLTERFDEVTAQSIRILYGGSVKPSNASELLQQPDIDGALVGGASLMAESFLKLVNITA